MNSMQRRALLYGGALVVLGAIGATAATVTSDADVMTLLSAADVQLRLAHGIPANDKQGAPLPARAEMIASAEASLVEVERIQPGMAVTAEFVGFAHMLRGHFAEAAAHYARARGCKDCAAEQRDVLAFNEARMLAQAGKHEQALAVFAANGKALDARFGHQRSLEEAAILRQLGRTADARARLDAVLADGAAMPLASLQAGVELMALGDDATAATVLGRTAADVPIADYHLALLKLRQGDVDSSLALLGRAATVLPAEVRRRLREEAAAWSAVAGDARFREITGAEAATPVR
jgi:tetratricopeptide (TPR) repeat protein